MSQHSLGPHSSVLGKMLGIGVPAPTARLEFGASIKTLVPLIILNVARSKEKWAQGRATSFTTNRPPSDGRKIGFESSPIQIVDVLIVVTMTRVGDVVCHLLLRDTLAVGVGTTTGAPGGSDVPLRDAVHASDETVVCRRRGELFGRGHRLDRVRRTAHHEEGRVHFLNLPSVKSFTSRTMTLLKSAQEYDWK